MLNEGRESLYRFDIERDGLHRQLGNGLPKGSTMLVTGGYGTGKSAVCQRLTYGFLQHAHTVTYISSELTTAGFLNQMNSLDYPVRESIVARDLLFIPVFPLLGSSKSRGDFLGRLMGAPALFGNDIIIIDTFSSLVKHDLNERRALLVLAFFKKLSAKSKTIILTMEERELAEEVMSSFKAVCDIYLELRTDVVEGNIERIIQVRRFSAALGYVGDTIGFRVEPGAGFIVDITMVA